MKTYYYLATVANASSQAVRTLTCTSLPNEAFASAAISLANAGFVVTAMQELTEAQYFAPNVAPVCYNVGLLPVAQYVERVEAMCIPMFDGGSTEIEVTNLVRKV